MNNIRFSLRRAILFAGLTVLAVLHSGKATAQDLETRYEQSLLDSAINYELLKPRYYTLSKSHEHVLRENVELRMQMRLLSFERENERRIFVQQIEMEKQKVKRIRRRLIGVVIIGTIAAAAGR